MSTSHLFSTTDVLVIGGGPAGLAAALVAQRAGLDVIVADRGLPPIDKACGEGLMPDGLAALQELGVELDPAAGMPFHGIRFIDGEVVCEGRFGQSHGLGMRRTDLHQALVSCVQGRGVTTCWQADIRGIANGQVNLNGKEIRYRWLVGADGMQSRTRRLAGLEPIWNSGRRLGLRQHFRIAPWTDLVEVHWQSGRQVYVTPVQQDEVCIALVAEGPGASLEELPAAFPRLGRQLSGAMPVGRLRGAFTMSHRLAAVTRDRVALVGDASGSVDSITGEGMALAFRQAFALGQAMADGSLARYAMQHRRISRRPMLAACALLSLARNDRLRKLTMRLLRAQPFIFDRLLTLHSAT